MTTQHKDPRAVIEQLVEALEVLNNLDADINFLNTNKLEEMVDAAITAGREALEAKESCIMPHTAAGFRAAFESEHKRKPTEQEIWNHAIPFVARLNPQARKPVGINGLTEAETSASMSVRGLSVPTVGLQSVHDAITNDPSLCEPAPQRPPNCGTGHCSCIECFMEPAPSTAGEREGCDMCLDPDGVPCFPEYGIGPHTCFYKIHGAVIGQSQPLPKDQWPSNYQEDPECPGMGVYWCAHCGQGKPAAQPAQGDLLDQLYTTIIQWDEGGGKRSRRELARRIAALLQSTHDARPVGELTEGDLMKCIAQAGCYGTVKLSYEIGPYGIDKPTLNATKLARAILAAARTQPERDRQ